eukprot:g41052.t1
MTQCMHFCAISGKELASQQPIQKNLKHMSSHHSSFPGPHSLAQRGRCVYLHPVTFLLLTSLIHWLSMLVILSSHVKKHPNQHRLNILELICQLKLILFHMIGLRGLE